jgi:hypothetical protein
MPESALPRHWRAYRPRAEFPQSTSLPGRTPLTRRPPRCGTTPGCRAYGLFGQVGGEGNETGVQRFEHLIVAPEGAALACLAQSALKTICATL